MPTYLYQAINESGNIVSGEIEADSYQSANSLLTTRGYIPAKVSEKGPAIPSILINKIKEKITTIRPSELILFTKQLKTMIKAGVPILKLLRVLENQTENIALRDMILEIYSDVEEGSSLHDAFRKHPKAFSPLYCSMLRAGEASGALPQILDRLIYILEHEHKVKSDIKSAFQYPIIVIAFLAVAFFILLTFVVPKFVNVFARANVDLPIPTKLCMFMYQFLTNYWILILLATVAGIVFIRYYLKTDKGKFTKDAFLMGLPLIGPLFVKAAMARFASIFSILQSSGVPVLDCIKILTETIGNSAISNEFEVVTERLEEGRGLAEPLRSARYFTPIVVNMVAIGEESDNLEEMLAEVAKHYDAEMEFAMKKLSDAIAPILTIGLAVVVGFFALAIYLPMWNMTQMAR